MATKLKIVSSRDSEFNSRFEIGDETYEVGTEDLGIKKCKVITRIYLKGEILSTVTSDYTHLVKLPDLPNKLMAVMEKQHKSAREAFIKKHSRPEKSKAHYAEEIKGYLKNGDTGAALDTARRALEHFPSDPFFLSHCGYLTSVVENKSREGTKICEEAIRIIRESESVDTVFFLPLFYLHLGRAYIRGSRKRAALDAFQSGLKYDAKNCELLADIQCLGIRKRPVIPFFDRRNPVNKYLGKFRYKIQSKK